MGTQQTGDSGSGVGRQEAGQQRRRKERSHRFKFHTEQHRRQGCSEQSGKHGAHARHDHDPALMALELQPLAQQGRHGAADLQRSTLPAGRAAEQVGHRRRQENSRRYHGRNVLPFQHRINDLIGAPVLFQLGQMVHGHRGKTCQGQQEDQPGMFSPDMGDEMQGMVEYCTHDTPQAPQHDSQDAQFQEDLYVILRMMQLFP